MKATWMCTLALVGAVTACGSGTQTVTTAMPTSRPTFTSSTPTPTPTCSTHSGFELSLVSDRGGQRTPVLASEWFARHDESIAHVPRTGWHEDGHDDMGVFTRSGAARLHVIEGPDKTWQVDSGTACSD